MNKQVSINITHQVGNAFIDNVIVGEAETKEEAIKIARQYANQNEWMYSVYANWEYRWGGIEVYESIDGEIMLNS